MSGEDLSKSLTRLCCWQFEIRLIVLLARTLPGSSYGWSRWSYQKAWLLVVQHQQPRSLRCCCRALNVMEADDHMQSCRAVGDLDVQLQVSEVSERTKKLRYGLTSASLRILLCLPNCDKLIFLKCLNNIHEHDRKHGRTLQVPFETSRPLFLHESHSWCAEGEIVGANEMQR